VIVRLVPALLVGSVSVTMVVNVWKNIAVVPVDPINSLARLVRALFIGELMKVIVAGSRGIKKYEQVEKIIEKAIADGLQITQIVSGGAKGVDTLGETWAVKKGVNIKRFPAEWDKYGISAGHIRNRQMGDYADALIAVWDGKSKGTKGMIDYATEKKLKVYVFILQPNGEFNVTINS